MNMQLPKNPPYRSESHLDYIRSLPCVLCAAPPPSEAAHFRLGLGGGTGYKPGDDLTLALCRAHHREQTLCKSGELGFWRKYLAIDKQLVVRIMRGFCRSFVRANPLTSTHLRGT